MQYFKLVQEKSDIHERSKNEENVLTELPIKMQEKNCGNCSCIALKCAMNVKYLGMHIDNHLKWNIHIDQVCKKIRLFMAQTYHVYDLVPLAVLKLVRYSLGKSALQYGITIYGHLAEYP